MASTNPALKTRKLVAIPSETPTNIKPKTNDGTKYLFTWFRLLGILMPDRYKVLYVLYSMTVNLFTIIILPATFTISYFVGSEAMEISHFLTSLQVAINVYACSSKFLIIAYLRQYLFKIEAILDKLDARASHPEEIREINRTIIFGQRMVVFFTVCYFSYSTTTFLGAVVSKRPPYSLYIPFLNWRTSTKNFAIASILEYLLIDIACFQEVANDSYAVIYISMVHSHLKILIMRISRIGSNPNLTQEDNMRELLGCIHDHKNIIDLINAVAPVISPTVFVQFMVSAAVLGTTLINIAISGNRSIIIGSVFFVAALVCELLPICYYVNCLVAEGERLPQAIFHMNWVDQSIEFRRMCLFFMHRSQQTMIFFAGKIFPITLDSFGSIVKFSFSLYTLLSKMDFGDRFN